MKIRHKESFNYRITLIFSRFLLGNLLICTCICMMNTSVYSTEKNLKIWLTWELRSNRSWGSLVNFIQLNKTINEKLVAVEVENFWFFFSFSMRNFFYLFIFLYYPQIQMFYSEKISSSILCSSLLLLWPFRTTMTKFIMVS